MSLSSWGVPWTRPLRRLGALLAALALVALTASGCAHTTASAPDGPGDASWCSYAAVAPLKPDKIAFSSFYVTMRDGIRIAVDLYLPPEAAQGARLPAIIHATRYGRAFELRWPFGRKSGGAYDDVRSRALATGYAWMDVDARGSGASFGHRPCPFSPDEVEDYGEVIDWIVAQPWSSGKVGATGISNDGTAAEFTAATGRPALKAVIPRFTLFDIYTDLAFPGGLHLTSFSGPYTRAVQALDSNELGRILEGWLPKMVVRGIAPVDADRDRSLLAQAVHSHRYHWNAHTQAMKSTFRDDIWVSDPRLTLNTFAPCGHVQELAQSGAAIYGYTGWFDGGYPHAAIKRILTVRAPGSRLVLGPWGHGGHMNASPLASGATRFDHAAEQLRFFDHHLKGVDNGIDAEKPIHYYTMGQARWKAVDAWPPPAEMTPFYFGPGQRLTTQQPADETACDTYEADYTAGTGERSRWNTLSDEGPVIYPDRAEEDRKLFTYTTGPLTEDTEVTGHPVARLWVSSTAADGQFFVYLEDVDEAGHVRYVTEGLLRALHRKTSTDAPLYESVVPYRTFTRADASPLVPGEATELVFDLLPTSYQFAKGHAIRIALAAADKDHFLLPDGPPPTLTYYRDRARASCVVLPLVTQ